MRLFNGISPSNGDITILTAVDRIFRYAQEKHLISRQSWSLAELRLDNDDYQWLCDWSQHLSEDTASLWLYREPLLRVPFNGGKFSCPSSIGTLLLMVAAEVTRREGNEGMLWAPLWRGHFPETTKRVLFMQGHPTRVHKDAIEAAARWLNLRHVFGKEGVQRWFDTVYLQLGFTKQGFMRRLPEWLVGQVQTQAIQHLLDGPMSSKTFQELWRDLLHFRQNKIKKEQLQSVLKNSPWVLPEWSDDLVRKAITRIDVLGYGEDIKPANTRAVFKPSLDRSSRQRNDLDYEADTHLLNTEVVFKPFLDEPKLHWNIFDDPYFTCTVSKSNLIELGLTDETYDIVIGERWCGRLQKQLDGTYTAEFSDEIRLPIFSPLLVANLVDSDGEVIQNFTLQSWNDDVTAFRMPSGSRFDAWKNTMHLDLPYILLLSPDLTIEPELAHWHILDNQAAKLYYLPPGWSSETHVLIGKETLWEPHLKTSSTATEPDWIHAVNVEQNEQKTLLFGEKVRVRVNHPQNVTILFIRLGSQSIDFVQHNGEYSLTQPITVEPGLFSHEARPTLQFLIGLRRNDERVRSIYCNVQLAIKGAAILTKDGWTALDAESTLTLEQAKTLPMRIFMKGIGDLALIEGDTWVRELPIRSCPIGRLTGLGASLLIRERPYNDPDILLKVAREVVDHGIIAEIVVDDIKVHTRTLSIRLFRSIEPDEQHSIIWWDKNGTIAMFTPECCEIQDDAMWWLSSVPNGLTQPLAIAVAYNGVRLGAWWQTNWNYVLMENTILNPMAIATMIRWFQLPILSYRFTHDIQEFAAAYPVQVLATWISDNNPPKNLQWYKNDDGWLSAVRTMFQKWEPDSYIAQEIVLELSRSKEEMLPPDIILRIASPLLKVDPLLMGKIVKMWAENVCIPQWGTHNAYRLISYLLYELAESDGSNAFIRKKDDLLKKIAWTMSVHPDFVKGGLIERALQAFQGQPIQAFDEDNITTALKRVGEFRTLLGICVLELINEAIITGGEKSVST